MAWFKKKDAAEPAEQTKHEKAVEDMAAFEQQDEVPRDPRDWPKGTQSHLTFGNKSDEAYGTGPTSMLSPAEVVHHDDGSVSVGGELVDDPEKYKGKPITGGILDQISEHVERNKQLREQEEGGGR